MEMTAEMVSSEAHKGVLLKLVWKSHKHNLVLDSDGKICSQLSFLSQFHFRSGDTTEMGNCSGNLFLIKFSFAFCP